VQAGAGQPVRVALHLPETQSTAGQAAEPSLHSSQATPSCGQSPRVWQLAPWSQISGAHTQLSWPWQESTRWPVTVMTQHLLPSVPLSTPTV
jgi:hypothetical protein